MRKKPSVPTPPSESELFQKHLREVIGDEPVAAFARRCGIPESNLRTYLDGKSPGLDRLAQLAEGAGVTIDWLVTGLGPKTRAEVKAAVSSQAAPLDVDLLVDVIEAVEEYLEQTGREHASAKNRARLFLAVYKYMVATRAQGETGKAVMHNFLKLVA